MNYMKIKNVAVYLGSKNGLTRFQEITKILGEELARNGYTIIYGGANVGTMGILADSALSEGGKVVGVFPDNFKGKVENHFNEILHPGLTELIKVESMSERKVVMEKMSDACIIMPGSYGTFDEFFEYVVNKQIGYHKKPILVFNVDGFYEPIKTMTNNMIEGGFLLETDGDLFSYCDTIDELLLKLKSH